MSTGARRKSAHGRPANKADREHAQFLAELASASLASPNGELCMNPEDPLEDRVYWSIDNLISELESFARNGRFVYDDFLMRDLEIRQRAKALMGTGAKRFEVVEALALEYQRSSKHIERIVTGIKSQRLKKS